MTKIYLNIFKKFYLIRIAPLPIINKAIIILSSNIYSKALNSLKILLLIDFPFKNKKL